MSLGKSKDDNFKGGSLLFSGKACLNCFGPLEDPPRVGKKCENTRRQAEIPAPTKLNEFICCFINIQYENQVSIHRNIIEYVSLEKKGFTNGFLGSRLTTLQIWFGVDPKRNFFAFSF